VLDMWDEADDEAVDGIARQFLERNGADALQMLLELAAEAEALQDHISATAWRDKAHAVERMLRS
jgi:uncharacterized protein YheU (UPF0270 family)